MRLVGLLVLLSVASCGSSLTDADLPGPVAVPEWSDADCSMFDPTACRLDVARSSLGIDVHYPAASFCRLQILPSHDLLDGEGLRRLASRWTVTMGWAAEQTVLSPAEPARTLEYSLGTEALYLTRVTFTSGTEASLATLAAETLGAGVSIYAVPVECPGQR